MSQKAVGAAVIDLMFLDMCYLSEMVIATPVLRNIDLW